MTEKEAKAAFKELGMKERIRQAKAGFAAQEAERGYEGLKPMHPLLREFETSAGKKKKSHEIPPSWHGGMLTKTCKKPSDEDVIKWWKYYHLRKSGSDQYDAAYRKRHATAEKKAFKKLQSANKCGIKKKAVDKLILKVPEKKREAAGIKLK